MMSTFAFVLMSGHGHVNPTLAVARELVRRGHRVSYFLAEQFREAVLATGAEFVGYEGDLGIDVGGPEWRPEPGKMPPVGRMVDAMTGLSERLAEPLQEFLSTVDPDLVVYESMALWAKFAVAGRDVKSAAISASYVMGRTSPAAAAMRAAVEKSGQPLFDPARLAAIAAKYGATIDDPNSFFVGDAPLTIAFMPAEFHPGWEQLSDSVHFVGPSLDDRGSDSDFDFSRLGDEQALFISLGTVFNQQAEFFRTCMKAFADAGPVVLAHGNKLSAEDFPDAPANFILAPHVPQLQVLRHSRVFVTHGGMNSTQEAIVNGVPLVVVPQMMEQEMTAKRVAELGLGVHVPPTEVTAEALAEAVATVDTPAYRERVAAIREASLASGGASRAADLLLDACN
jgi:MGT family glycosyltransferase